MQFFDKWTLSQLDAADYEEAPPAPDWVVQEAAQREGTSRRSEYETREALAGELPGFAGIKHHISEDEMMERRRNSVALEDGGGATAATGAGVLSMRRRSSKAERSSREHGGRHGSGGTGGGGSSGVAAVSAVPASEEGTVRVDVAQALQRRSRELPDPVDE